jgi:hypothetical protein
MACPFMARPPSNVTGSVDVDALTLGHPTLVSALAVRSSPKRMRLEAMGLRTAVLVGEPGWPPVLVSASGAAEFREPGRHLQAVQSCVKDRNEREQRPGAVEDRRRAADRGDRSSLWMTECW